jgi:hypothetical protein
MSAPSLVESVEPFFLLRIEEWGRWQPPRLPLLLASDPPWEYRPETAKQCEIGKLPKGATRSAATCSPCFLPSVLYTGELRDRQSRSGIDRKEVAGRGAPVVSLAARQAACLSF